MSGFRFDVGQQVVVHGLVINKCLNGMTSEIVRRHNGFVRSRSAGKRYGPDHFYWLTNGRYFFERNLAPRDEAGSWELCGWKPEKVNI